MFIILGETQPEKSQQEKSRKTDRKVVVVVVVVGGDVNGYGQPDRNMSVFYWLSLFVS